jgi:hypothetical protein
MTDRYIADFLADKSADRSVRIRIGKLRVDWPYLTDMETTRIGLDRPIARTLRLCVHFLIQQLCAAGVGQNKRIVSAVADIRKITTVSANQPMVEADELHQLTAVTMKHHRFN